MNQEILNNLKAGEKAADIQEYYWGKDGYKKAYKVTIYSCEKVPFLKIFKKRGISEYTYPIYFETKEFAQEFISCHDKFSIKTVKEHSKYFLCYQLNVNDIKNQKYEYNLIDTTIPLHSDPLHSEKDDKLLYAGGIWNGYVNFGSYLRPYKKQTIYYTDIFKKEEKAAKEGTTGETFSYKLYNINDGK